jgi:hypothetical protein
VTGVLLNHVHVDPAQRVPLATSDVRVVPARVPRHRGCAHTRPVMWRGLSPLLLIEWDKVALVNVRIDPDERRTIALQHALGPNALDLGHVAYQTVKRPGLRWRLVVA